MSPRLFQDLMVFVPDVTQGNEMRGQSRIIFSFPMVLKEMRTRGQCKVSSCCFFGVNQEN